jgi:hypothetical protein
MMRRNIPLERQQEIKTSLKGVRRTFRDLEKMSRKMIRSAWADVEIVQCRGRVQAIRDNLDGFLAELNGHGPAALMDSCARLRNNLSAINSNLEDAEWMRRR